MASKGRNALKPSFASESKHLATHSAASSVPLLLQALPILCQLTGQVFFLNIFLPQCYHWKPSSTLQNEDEDSRWQCTGSGGRERTGEKLGRETQEGSMPVFKKGSVTGKSFVLPLSIPGFEKELSNQQKLAGQ